MAPEELTPGGGRPATAFRWCFENRETGAITVAQAPNLLLWLAIVAAILQAALHPPGGWGFALAILFKGSLVLWALDEIVRGVNPWRRTLGTGVIFYEAVTLLG